ncbi:MAG: hypothetical protein R2758_15355 [Bacteroidales bacterium]
MWPQGQPRERCDAWYGGPTGLAVNLDFRDAIKNRAKAIEAKYGNLFDMYKDIITGIDPMRNQCVSDSCDTIPWEACGSTMS